MGESDGERGGAGEGGRGEKEVMEEGEEGGREGGREGDRRREKWREIEREGGRKKEESELGCTCV